MSTPTCDGCTRRLQWIDAPPGWSCDRCRAFYPITPEPPLVRERVPTRSWVLPSVITVLALCGVVTIALVRDFAHSEETEMERAKAQMRAFTDQMCLCSDKACADRVTDELTRWGTEMARTADKNAKPSEWDTREMTAIVDRYSKCMMFAFERDPRVDNAPLIR